MNYYHFGFPGQVLGGIAIVKARTEKAARKLLLTLYPKMPNEQFKLEDTVRVTTKPEIVYDWDGDY